MKPTFACVYRTGGDYNTRDVLRLKHNVEKRTTMDFNFVCLTDDTTLLLTNEHGVVVDSVTEEHWAQPLFGNYKGWWSLIELFRLTGPVVITGLDTVFVGSVDPFLQLAKSLTEEEFYMIHAFKKNEVWASGFMIWNGDWSWLLDDFKYKEHSAKYQWEQRYTKFSLLKRGVEIKGVQDQIDGIYSYKHHCRGKGGPPKDARAILFHGRPRPGNVRESWIKKEWK